MIKSLCSIVLICVLLSSCGVYQSIPVETNTPLTTEPAMQSTATSKNDIDNTTQPENLIGKERAKEIALQKAGITNGEVVFDRVELDRDNGVLHYEVEFKKGLTEYDADINAVDGTIITWETDIDD